MKSQAQVARKNKQSPKSVQIHRRQILVQGQLADLVKRGAKLMRVTPKRFVLDAVSEAISKQNAKMHRRETLAFIEQHATAEQLEWLNAKLDELVSLSKGSAAARFA